MEPQLVAWSFIVSKGLKFDDKGENDDNCWQVVEQDESLASKSINEDVCI